MGAATSGVSSRPAYTFAPARPLSCLTTENSVMGQLCSGSAEHKPNPPTKEQADDVHIDDDIAAVMETTLTKVMPPMERLVALTKAAVVFKKKAQQARDAVATGKAEPLTPIQRKAIDDSRNGGRLGREDSIVAGLALLNDRLKNHGLQMRNVGDDG